MPWGEGGSDQGGTSRETMLGVSARPRGMGAGATAGGWAAGGMAAPASGLGGGINPGKPGDGAGGGLGKGGTFPAVRGGSVAGLGEVIIVPHPGHGPEAPAISAGTVNAMPQAWQVK